MYTKEPWSFEPAEPQREGCFYILDSEQNVAVANVYNYKCEKGAGAANARRIVACVNACAGSSTEGLEEMVIAGRSVANMAMLYERAMDHRDELLAALKEVLESGEDGDWQSGRKIATEAIAKAEGA